MPAASSAASTSPTSARHFNSADLGYRVGEHDGGRGIASQAVALCLEDAFSAHGLWRMEAVARPENRGSVRVLERNGFRQFGHSRRSFELNGQWFDRLLFERHRDLPHEPVQRRQPCGRDGRPAATGQ